MKKSSLIMLIIGMSLSVAGLICLIIGSWDKLEAACGSVKRKAFRPKEYDDYDDVDDL